MARLNIKWKTQSTVAPTAAATGDAEAKDAAVGRRHAERPMLVYVMSDDNTDSATRKLEDVCFADERVGIGSKFFDCIKITAGDAMQDRLISKHGKDTPRLLMVTRDYNVKDVLSKKKLSSGKIVRGMSKLTKSEYKTSFDKMVSNYAKLLNELDRLEGKKGQIADSIKRASGNKSKLKKAEREQAEYEKAMDEWKKAEAKLLGFKLKEMKKPKV
jgi:predicted nuclease with TOPRIM domain